MKRVSMRYQGVGRRTRVGYNYSFVIHDFRLYDEVNLSTPKHINTEASCKNEVLYLSEDFPDDDPFKYFVWKDYLYEEEKKLWADVKKLSETKGVPHLSSLKYTFVGVIVTFNAEAVNELKNDPEFLSKVKERVKEFFLDLGKILGVKPYYLVIHLDEASPHFHGLYRNYRDYDLGASIDDDSELTLLSLKYGIKNDLLLRIKKGFGRSFTGTFTVRPVKSYQLQPSFLQDLVSRAFIEFGIFRGVKKDVRAITGEPYWKWVHRSVERLHQDLPMEIALKEVELEALTKKIEELTEFIVEQKSKLEELNRKIKEKELELEEKKKRYRESEERLKSRLKEIERKEVERVKKTIEEATKSLNEEIRRKALELESLKAKQRVLERSIVEYEKELNEKRKALLTIEVQLGTLTKELEKKKKELEESEKKKKEVEDRVKSLEKRLLDLTNKVKEEEETLEVVSYVLKNAKDVASASKQERAIIDTVLNFVANNGKLSDLAELKSLPLYKVVASVEEIMRINDILNSPLPYEERKELERDRERAIKNLINVVNRPDVYKYLTAHKVLDKKR